MGLAMPQPAPPTLTPVSVSTLAGWGDDDHAAALAAFRRSCADLLGSAKAFHRPARFGGDAEAWRGVCRAALTATAARQFFEDHFNAWQVEDRDRPEGLFTGYYEPQADGSRTADPAYPAPVLRAPADLVMFDAATEAKLGLRYGRVVSGVPQPYFTRAEIEAGALAGRGLELAWMRDWADLFFMQVQGSGRLSLPDGTVMRLAYAAKTGLPYSAIGGVLVKRGAFPAELNSMRQIRAWMKAHPQAARALMQENQSYVFFREVAVEDASLGPPGAQEVNLTSGRSLAVDRTQWQFGTPVWLEAHVPSGPGETLEPFHRLLIAQDTGSAIKGLARGDVFWGTGERAGAIAGLMKAPGRMVVLLPKAIDPR